MPPKQPKEPISLFPVIDVRCLIWSFVPQNTVAGMIIRKIKTKIAKLIFLYIITTFFTTENTELCVITGFTPSRE